jgi:subfamily B ATP-binding cassette protein MsbA
VADLRLALFRRLSGLSLRYFHDRQTGELLSRVIADVGALQNLLTRLIGPAVSSIIQVLAISAFILWLKWQLAVVALVVFPVAYWPIRAHGRKLRALSRRVQELAGDLAAHLQEILSQMKLVQAYRGEEREVARWDRKLKDQLAVAMRALRVQSRSSPIMETIGAGGFAALVLFAVSDLPWFGVMTGGSLVTFFGAVLRLYPNIKHLNGLWNNIQTGLGAAERIFPVLDEVPEVRDAPDAAPLQPFRESIRYEGVEFAFRAGTPVLGGVSLEIPRGRRVAFVGPSGAGKTTLMDLLLRFYDPTAGRVTVDGRDLRGVTLASLRGQVALVSQEVLLFNASARDNLLYARPEATEAEMIAASTAAGAHGFIAALPRGYDTEIGDRGVRLSGGERQRLSIARAFLRDAPILVLDEATASLDAASEALVQAELDQLMANRTVLIVAHRLTTVRRADEIVVLDQGRIAERGTHDALYAGGGLYRSLCDLQFADAPGA